MSVVNFRAWVPVERWREQRAVIAVLPLVGVIGGMGNFRRGLSLLSLSSRIEKAFKIKGLAGVVLAVNSPGGSPVQSALISKRIRDLAQEKDIPVYAFIEDVGASGGYWLACAADHIYAQSTSIVGSIGVVSGGFGFVEMISKLGIERRLHSAGEKKAMLDPFSPEKPAHVKHLKILQSEMHEEFKEMVRERRAGKLKEEEKELFSGAFWTGKKAMEMGLIDDLGDLHQVMQRLYGDKVKIRMIDERRPWWRQRFTVKRDVAYSDLGYEYTGSLMAAIEERMIWNRFGL
ncbi:MAG: S49 family peptidase [Magnetovibrio sp.]|nr:S49 family peptidase [Magnetovibrio sp.]